MASVTFRNVSRRYGDTYAVRGLDLDIADEEFLVLVGPSGCGKSTTLRMLAGLEDVSEGEILIGDRPVSNVPARDRNIAMVFQSYALYPHMSVYDNMAFSLQLRKAGKQEIRERVQQAADILGIEDLLGRKPRQLSGGQRQRVALGRAIVRDPEVFLLDEPLSNLDAKLRVRTRAEISKLHERLRTTFVYVTHDQVEAMTMATRIAVMDHGELQQVGTPQELYDHPRNRFVAEFIGSPAMNIFAVRVLESGENLTLEADGVRIIVPASQGHLFAPWRGQSLLVGIRPEDIYDAAFLPAGIDGTEVTATVDVAELLGNETLLHVRAGATEFLARVDPRTMARPGQEARFILNMSRLHRFSPETAEALSVTP